MHDDAIEQLQTKIAYLEAANAEISDLVFRQHRELQALSLRVQQLVERLNAVVAEERRSTTEEERPPHY